MLSRNFWYCGSDVKFMLIFVFKNVATTVFHVVCCVHKCLIVPVRCLSMMIFYFIMSYSVKLSTYSQSVLVVAQTLWLRRACGLFFSFIKR